MTIRVQLCHLVSLILNHQGVLAIKRICLLGSIPSPPVTPLDSGVYGQEMRFAPQPHHVMVRDLGSTTALGRPATMPTTVQNGRTNPSWKRRVAATPQGGPDTCVSASLYTISDSGGVRMHRHEPEAGSADVPRTRTSPSDVIWRV